MPLRSRTIGRRRTGPDSVPRLSLWNAPIFEYGISVRVAVQSAQSGRPKCPCLSLKPSQPQRLHDFRGVVLLDRSNDDTCVVAFVLEVVDQAGDRRPVVVSLTYRLSSLFLRIPLRVPTTMTALRSTTYRSRCFGADGLSSPFCRNSVRRSPTDHDHIP